MEIIAFVIAEFMHNGSDLRLWARVLPWVLMACVVAVSLAFSYSLIK